MKRFTLWFATLAAALAALVWAPFAYAAEPYDGIVVAAGQTASGFGFGGFLIVAVIVVAAILVYLKIKKPATFTSVMTKAKALETEAEGLIKKAPAAAPVLNTAADGTKTPAAQDAAMQAELVALRASAAASAKAAADAALAKAAAPVVAPAAVVVPAPVPAPVAAMLSALPQPAPAPDMVAVIPTGPNALGAARLYPVQLSTDYNLLTYCSRISAIMNPTTGAPFFPPGSVGSVVLFPSAGKTWPECVDRMLFPSDWWTADEVASKANAASAHSDAAVWDGPIPLSSLTLWTAQTNGWTDEVRDSDFLWWASVQGQVPEAWHIIVGGVSSDMAAAIGAGEYHYNWLVGKGVNIDAAYGPGKCRAAFDAAKAGTLKAKYH